MKRWIVVCGVIMAALFAAGSIVPVDCFAWRQAYEDNLTSDPKLDEANRLYKNALRWIKDGNGVHEPQRAAEFYAVGESYLRRAVYSLKGLGSKYGIDVAKEIEFCEKLERETHSDQGEAKREST